MTEIELPPPPRQVRLSGMAWFLRALLWLLVPLVGLGLAWLAGTNSRQWGRIQDSELGRHGLLTTGTVTAHEHVLAKVRYRYEVGAKTWDGEAELPAGSKEPSIGDLISIHYFTATPQRSVIVPPGAAPPAGTRDDPWAKVTSCAPERWELLHAFEVAGKRHVGHAGRFLPPDGSEWPAVGSSIRVLYDQRDPEQNQNEVEQPAIVLRMKPQAYVWVIPIASGLLLAALALEAFLRRLRRFSGVARSAVAEVVSNEDATGYWFQWVTLATAVLSLGRMPYLQYHAVRYRVRCGGEDVERSSYIPVNTAREWQPGQRVQAFVNDADGQHRLGCELSGWVRASAR